MKRLLDAVRTVLLLGPVACLLAAFALWIAIDDAAAEARQRRRLARALRRARLQRRRTCPAWLLAARSTR